MLQLYWKRCFHFTALTNPSVTDILYRRHLPYEGRQRELINSGFQNENIHNFRACSKSCTQRSWSCTCEANCTLRLVAKAAHVLQLNDSGDGPFLSTFWLSKGKSWPDSEVALHASEVRQSRSEVTTLLSVNCSQANSSGKFLFQKHKVIKR